MTTKAHKVVLITGAAGGLGQGLARAFADAGWQVAAGWHRAEVAPASASVWPVQLNVTSPECVHSAVKTILSRWGRIDALINNAGIVADSALWQMDEAAWDQVLSVNLKGAVWCAQTVLRPMLRQRDGHIINIASFSARVGARGQANYAAAKAGLLGFTQSLAKEVGPRNVRVNAVLPGVLPTAMTAGLPPATKRAFATANALGRLNSIAEVAAFVVFLATLRNVSGQVFQLDSRTVPWT